MMKINESLQFATCQDLISGKYFKINRNTLNFKGLVEKINCQSLGLVTLTLGLIDCPTSQVPATLTMLIDQATRG